MIEEVSAQYLKELQAEKEELEKNYSDNAHAIKLLQNGEDNSFVIPPWGFQWIFCNLFSFGRI